MGFFGFCFFWLVGFVAFKTAIIVLCRLCLIYGNGAKAADALSKQDERRYMPKELLEKSSV